MTDTLFIRLLHYDDKGAALAERLAALRQGRADGDVYTVAPESFRQVPNTPFCYWVSERIRRLFTELPPFEGDGRTVKQGLATADDFRFVRAWWEVPAERILDGMRYAVGGRQTAEGSEEREKWTEERIREFQAWCRQRTYEGKRWVPFAKGGEYSPYYADIHLVVNWEKEGAEIRNFVDPKTGKTNSRPQNTDYYFRPGLTYTSYTNLGFAPRILMAGSVFSVAGMGIHGIKKCLLVFLNSTVVQRFLYLIADRRKWEAGVIQRLPVPNFYYHIPELNLLSDQAWSLKRSLDLIDGTSHAFTLPTSLQCQGLTIAERAAAWAAGVSNAETELARIQVEIDEIAFELYGFTEEERKPAGSMKYASGGENSGEVDEDANNDEETVTADAATNPSSPAFRRQHTAYLLSWCVGVAFGRWDIRFALPTAYRLPSTGFPDPFDPLPVCPPGMLVGPDGLPAEPGRIVSEAWLRKRAEGGMQYADGIWTIPDGDDSLPTALCVLPTDADYPVRIQWDGVLVDDPGFNAAPPHREDIVRRVREVLDLIWQDQAPDIEQEACDILGVAELREYFRRPGGFFQDHLKRYSKSRRKAPIYWPLSTASGSYTVWLYYHRLTDQTLYLVVNKYVEPKIAEVERALARLEDELASASGRDAARLRDRLNEGRTFLGELRDFREELLRVAALPYKPNLNDGVIINAAPLHKLFRLRSWAKDTEECRQKLQKGDYDWAHLAYTVWPDRVREVCKKDRSIAIAHGLEDICEIKAPEKAGKKSRRKKV